MPTNDITVWEVEPAADALVRTALPEPDYRDALRVRVPAGLFSDIDDFAKSFFLAQPFWMRTISMNLPSRAKLENAIEQAGFGPGEKIGSWRIYERNENEIVFGETLGFMTYRFSLRFTETNGEGTVEASTVARLSNILARVYFSVVRLVHKPFIRMALISALKSKARPRAI